MALNSPKTFIFIGRSGCGKGTQIKLLEEYLKNKTPQFSVFAVETGDNFREFLSSDTYASKLSREIYEKGALQPEFLAVYMWGEKMIKNLTGKEHLILDGSPRRLREALVLDTALSFFKRTEPVVIYLDVSKDWSREHLKKRGRADDIKEKDIERRLDWFDAEVMPAVEWLKKNPAYKFVELKGEQTIENVFKNLTKAVFGE